MVKSRTYIATPPGETVREMLEERGIGMTGFAQMTGMTEERAGAIVSGEEAVTPETAVLLERVLGAPAEFWNALESLYREKLKKADEENRADGRTVRGERA